MVVLRWTGASSSDAGVTDERFDGVCGVGDLAMEQCLWDNVLRCLLRHECFAAVPGEPDRDKPKRVVYRRPDLLLADRGEECFWRCTELGDMVVLVLGRARFVCPRFAVERVHGRCGVGDLAVE